MKRKACRRDVKATLKRLDITDAGDRLTRAWLASRCSLCLACPKMALKLLTPPA